MEASNQTQQKDTAFETWIAAEIRDESVTEEEIEAWSLFSTCPDADGEQEGGE